MAIEMLANPDLYPTPSRLGAKMKGKIKGNPRNILDPQAGKGDLIEILMERDYDHRFINCNICAIEIDEELQATLRGKRIKVIDSDFLSYSGLDKFDLIIMNPPFSEGDKHLLKAIEIMYRGQIICLLNAETLKNPYTNTRKELVKKLKELNAEIEYIEGAFKNAERPTDVEVALVDITIVRNVEEDLFEGCDDQVDREAPELKEKHELTTGRNIEDMVAEYNEIVQVGMETIAGYFRNYRKIGRFIGLDEEAAKNHFSYSREDMTDTMAKRVNVFLAEVRKSFWRRALDLKEVRSRLTAQKRSEFEHQVEDHCNMEFTTRNIRQFVLNLINSYEKTLTDAVLDIFDKFTKRHSFSNGLYDDNIHYFSGWKTNDAFRVKRRVIIPVYGRHDGPFTDFMGKWKLDYKVEEELRDIDLVMNYFDGMGSFMSLASAVEQALSRQQTSKIYSTYFTATVYKKGTIHLTFNDEDILRRFNLCACKGKEWLPHDYGTKRYEDMDGEERAVVESFEGADSYRVNLGRPLFAPGESLLRLTA